MIGAQCYFLGILWYIICGLHTEEEGFIEYFGINNFNPGETPALIVIKMTYFTLTTMTTIGFGDFHPRTNTERMLMSIYFLIGTAIFSYAMNEFMVMIEKINH